ncbi:MAG: class IV adenylate cyclase [Pirellulales bacterium]|nr:class IV adenylate cyclase [Pirellulales bacterium]
MRFEVEMKFPVADPSELEARLKQLGATILAAQNEVDVYFTHPARDFAASDEALRLRRKGSTHSIAYKGPKIDAATKTRREIDLPLPADAAGFEAWFELLGVLGFGVAGEVRKSRRKARLLWQGRNVEVSLDSVDRLGQFVELELLVEDAASVEAAKGCIASLAAELGLESSERRSYLELLLA